MLKSEKWLKWQIKGNIRIKGLHKNGQIVISGSKKQNMNVNENAEGTCKEKNQCFRKHY